MNSAGVALAADSAVMIGNEKIYNSALKVFALSKAEPVGIMVYGNAALMNVPWETIIKIFRKELSTTSYDTLPEYSDSFFSFLASRTDLFPTEAQESWLASNVSKYYRSILQDLTSRVDKHIYDTGEMNVSTTKEYMKEIIDEHHMHLANRSFLDGLDKKFEDELRKKYSIKIRAIREDMFKELPISRQVATKLDAIAAMICSKDIFSQSKSGVVIAGFGNKDIYPSVETNVIEGVICGRVKKKRLSAKSTRIQKGTECAVIAFAQADMVAAFMNGINPSIRDFVTSCLGKVFNRLPDLINQEALLGNQDVKDEVLKQYGADIQELLKQFFDQLKSTFRMSTFNQFCTWSTPYQKMNSPQWQRLLSI